MQKQGDVPLYPTKLQIQHPHIGSVMSFEELFDKKEHFEFPRISLMRSFFRDSEPTISCDIKNGKTHQNIIARSKSKRKCWKKM